MDELIKSLWGRLPILQLAKRCGCSTTHLYDRAKAIGLPIAIVPTWTAEELAYLQQHYKDMTDKCIAQALQQLYPREKPRSKESVWAKRQRMGWIPTPTEQAAKLAPYRGKEVMDHIRYNRWKGRTAEEGTIKWRETPTRQVWEIKINGKWIPYLRYRYQELYGKLPKGWAVIAADGNPHNKEDSNLRAIPPEQRSQQAILATTTLSDKYIATLLNKKYGIAPEEALLNKDIIAAHRAVLATKRKLKHKNQPT